MGRIKLKKVAGLGLGVLTCFSYSCSNMATVAAANEEVTEQTKELRAEGRYSIGTPKGLVMLSKLQRARKVKKGAKIFLTNDIDLTKMHCHKFEKWAYQYTQWSRAEGEEFMPIGDCEVNTNGKLVRNSFKGDLNGDGHSVKINLNRNGKDYNGLFGYVGTYGKISNLTVKGLVSAYPNEKSEMGWFTGGVAGVSFGTMTNVCSKVLIYSNSEAGGVTGKNGGTLRGCKNEGNVVSGANVGGLAGWNKGQVLSCVNLGTVQGSSCVGGIAGYISGENAKIEDCCNMAKISSDALAGGISGKNCGVLSGCTNKGNVTAGINAGGVTGWNGKMTVNCGNFGAVQGNICSGSCVGGVVGYNNGKDGNIESCYNVADIFAVGRSVGGVAGKNSARVQNCYNLGAVVSEDEDAGGLIGENTQSGSLRNSYSTGRVKVAGNRCAGGLIGYKQAGSKTANCYYLKGASQGAVNGSSKGYKTAEKTEEELKESAFVSLLNGTKGSAFVLAKGRTPKLRIENKNGN